MKIKSFPAETYGQESLQCSSCSHNTDTLYVLTQSDHEFVSGQTVIEQGLCGDCLSRNLANRKVDIEFLAQDFPDIPA